MLADPFSMIGVSGGEREAESPGQINESHALKLIALDSDCAGSSLDMLVTEIDESCRCQGLHSHD